MLEPREVDFIKKHIENADELLSSSDPNDFKIIYKILLSLEKSMRSSTKNVLAEKSINNNYDWIKRRKKETLDKMLEIGDKYASILN